MQRGQPPLFVLSFRQRDELAALVARGGWQAVAARRGEAAERRFRASGAALALIDARGAFEDGLAALEAFGAAGTRPVATLVCVSRNDIDRLSLMFDAGATHFIASPFGESELLQAIRFAARGAERRDAAGAGSDLLGWRWDPDRRLVQLSPPLARLAERPEAIDRRSALALLPQEQRAALVEQLRQLDAPTALVQVLPPLGRVVQHLQRDARTGRVLALVEPLGHPPDVAAVLQDVMPATRDAAGTRRWIDHALQDGSTVHILSVALSRLDIVNLAYGRAAGDGLIRSAAKRIEEVASAVPGVRPLLARLDGSAFALLARHPLAGLAGPVENALSRPFVVEGELLPVGATVRHVASRAGEGAAALLKRALEDGHEGELSLDTLAAQLRDAMERGEVDILWQPQVAVASGAIVGVEALARWQHPSLGQIGAETLFAAAERAGLALALSAHVQALALTRAAAWPAVLSALRLSINVTAADVARGGFADLLLDRVDTSGFPRARLTVEITEGGLMAELGDAARLLAELRRAGLRVAIDDFGTGYSSLAYLKALPLDYLKIDKALSQDIAGSPRDRIVVRGVIDMARSLGLVVIAEGVETEEQLELLAKEGCQYFQGFLCAPPLTGDALETLLSQAEASR